MNIGNLNKRVSVLKYVSTRDSYGGEDGEWQAVLALWANVKPKSGTEYFENDEIKAEATVDIIIRYNPVINQMMRIEYKNKIYEILGIVDDNERHITMTLNCKELVNHELQCKAEES